MKKENFSRAKQIETEIKTIEEYLNAARSDKRDICTLNIKGVICINNKEEWAVNQYNYTTAPGFLENIIKEELEDVADKIVRKGEKRIKELEKEFDNL